MNKHTVPLSADQQQILTSVFLQLGNSSIAAAEGGGIYGIAKAEILALLPTNLATEINNLFNQFEAALADQALQQSQQDTRKSILQKIVDTINANVAPKGQTPSATQIDQTDMDGIIMPDICKIMQAYAISSSFCSTADMKAVPDNLTVENGTSPSGGSSVLKIIFIIIGSLIGVFGILVTIFAIRAKRQQEEEEEEIPPTAGAAPSAPTPQAPPVAQQ
jgi:hypothetical protein